MGATTVLIGLGGNRRHGRHGAPAAVLAAAIVELGRQAGTVLAVSPTIATAPLGPGGRRYANAAAILRTQLPPPALLALLKAIERRFGRRGGRCWGARVLDLDMLAFADGRSWHERTLIVPHPRFAGRRFALDPAAAIAGDWPVPRTGARVRHLAARARRRRPVDRGRPHF